MPWMMSKHRRQPAQKHTDSKARHGMARGLNNTTANIKHGLSRCGTYTVIYSFFSSWHLSDHLLEVDVGNMRPGHSEQQRSSQHAATLPPIGAAPDRKFSVHVRTLPSPNTTSLVVTQKSRTSEHSVTKSKLHMAAARAARPAKAPANPRSEHRFVRTGNCKIQ